MKSIPQTPKLKPNMRSEASTMLQWLNQSRWYKNVIDTVLWCLLCITLSLKYTICLKHESKLVAQACIHTYMHNIAKIHTHTHIHHTQTYIHTYIHTYYTYIRSTCIYIYTVYVYVHVMRSEKKAMDLLSNDDDGGFFFSSPAEEGHDTNSNFRARVLRRRPSPFSTVCFSVPCATFQKLSIEIGDLFEKSVSRIRLEGFPFK